jgi:hypothetical protein
MKTEKHHNLNLCRCFKKSSKSLFLILFASVFVVISTLSGHGQSLVQIQTPESVARGSIVTLSLPVQSIPKAKITNKDVSLVLNGSRIVSNRISFDSSEKFLNSVDFIIPESTTLGKNSARIDIKENNIDTKRIALPKPLNIVGSLGNLSPEINSISKLINFPEKDNTYSFSVIGKNFGTDLENDNKLFLSDIKNEDGNFIEGTNVKICWSGEDKKECQNHIKGEVVSNRELKFQGIPKRYAGELGVQIGIGENFSNIYPTFLSPVLKETPKKWSTYITLGLMIIIVLIQSASILKSARTNGKQSKDSFLKNFFLESETNTLSLSRFQFYIWTFTAILSYLYLLFSRSLIQSKFEFIDIPSGLPGIVFISATTTFLSLGITSNKGSKGAGDIHSNWSDLITVGGVVAPERLQFLVWTILGSLVFLFITFFQNPETIQDLPQIPQGFLQLMGISSFGYLGGKIARKAGPVINEVTANHIGNTVVFDIRGGQLSQDAVFRIGSEPIASSDIDGTKPTIITPEDSNEPSLAKHLQFTLNSAVSTLINNLEQKNFQIINPDGQYADWKISALHKLGVSSNPLLPTRDPPSQPSRPALPPNVVPQNLDPRSNTHSDQASINPRTHRGLLDPDAE